jgi:hypothetical protein
MRTPPQNFRWKFRRIVEETFKRSGLNLRLFRNEYDYDHFLEVTAPECCDERHLAFNFLCRFMPIATERYSGVLAIAVMSFLSQSLGRVEPDVSDIQSLRALADMPVKDQSQLTNWINCYFEFPA